ncbi:glycosyltransferase [Capnocytophaga sp. oral taxon 323]|nr:glycosyltransferase [Capnocytophaga sp. oral taxon 323]
MPKWETLAKCIPQKRCIGTVRSFRKETEGFGRGEGGFLMKKGFEEGGGSL